jgi:hypothetical protein
MFEKKKQWQKLQEAVQQDNPEQIVAKYFKYAKLYEACNLAIQHNASKVLEALLRTDGVAEGKKFVFASESFSKSIWENSRPKARELIAAALSSTAPLPLLLALYNANKTAYSFGKLDNIDFLTKDAPIELVQTVLEEHPSLFDHCVKNIGLPSAENDKLRIILAFKSKCRDSQSTLDRALMSVAATGEVEKAKLLLECNANPNNEGAQPLSSAANNGHQEMVNLLLPLVDPDLRADILTRRELTKTPDDPIIRAFQTAAQNQGRKAEVAIAPPSSLEHCFNRLSAEVLEEVQPLSDGSTLTTLFNFSTRQGTATREKGDITLSSSLFNLNDMDQGVIADRQAKLAEPAETQQPRVGKFRPVLSMSGAGE